jgi:hypothetical protein
MGVIGNRQLRFLNGNVAEADEAVRVAAADLGDEIVDGTHALSAKTTSQASAISIFWFDDRHGRAKRASFIHGTFQEQLLFLGFSDGRGTVKCVSLHSRNFSRTVTISGIF